MYRAVLQHGAAAPAPVVTLVQALTVEKLLPPSSVAVSQGLGSDLDSTPLPAPLQVITSLRSRVWWQQAKSFAPVGCA